MTSTLAMAHPELNSKAFSVLSLIRSLMRENKFATDVIAIPHFQYWWLVLLYSFLIALLRILGAFGLLWIISFLFKNRENRELFSQIAQKILIGLDFCSFLIHVVGSSERPNRTGSSSVEPGSSMRFDRTQKFNSPNQNRTKSVPK